MLNCKNEKQTEIEAEIPVHNLTLRCTFEYKEKDKSMFALIDPNNNSVNLWRMDNKQKQHYRQIIQRVPELCHLLKFYLRKIHCELWLTKQKKIVKLKRFFN